MVDSYETIDFLREQKIKLGNATYIVNSHFLDQRCVTAHDILRPKSFLIWKFVARNFIL